MRQFTCCRPLVPVCLSFMLSVGTGAAEEGQDFRKHYQQALSFYERGQYQESIQEFQAAYAIKQLPKLVLNMGQAHRKLGHAKEALGYYELYLRIEPDPEPKLKAELDRYIQQTRMMLAAAERIREESQAASRQAAQERAQEQQLGAAVSGEHVHCLDAAATGDDGAPGSQTAAADDCCDDCSVCHHVAFSLVFLPLVPDALDFSPVRVARDLLPGASRVPPQPDRPPRSAVA